MEEMDTWKEDGYLELPGSLSLSLSGREGSGARARRDINFAVSRLVMALIGSAASRLAASQNFIQICESGGGEEEEEEEEEEEGGRASGLGGGWAQRRDLNFIRSLT